MREFIESYPIFSYISVPILLVVLLALIYFVLRPKSIVRNHFARLYTLVLDTIEYIEAREGSFGQNELKYSFKQLHRMKSLYEMLESEELYEVEGIIKNIETARSIVRSLIVLKANNGEISNYLLEILTELKAIRKALFSFNLTREDADSSDYSIIDKLSREKSKEKAASYLNSLKQQKK